MPSPIARPENFFIEGSGKAFITSDKGALQLVHLQDMSLELSSTMENIYGGESNFSLYSYQSERGGKVTFTNASMNIDILSLTQGVELDSKVVLFKDEVITTDANGDFTLTLPNTGDQIDWSTVVVTKESDGSKLDVTPGSGTTGELGVTNANTTINVFYTYVTQTNAIGTSVFTTSVPGYVTIYHRSKAMKQKNGRIIRIFTTIFRARSDGSLTIDFKHKTAFAPELTFEIVDPERSDNRFLSWSIQDTTDVDGNDENLVYPIN